MKMATILREAITDGIKLTLPTRNNLKVAGDEQTLLRWLPSLRDSKPQIVTLYDLVGKAVEGLPVSPDELISSFFTAADIDDIVTGMMPVATIRAGVVSWLRWTRSATTANPNKTKEGALNGNGFNKF